MTSIEWTEEVWNPVTGCDKISPGCAHCYAEVMAKRCKAMGNARYANGFKVTLQPDKLGEPLKWRKPRKVFVNSMSDLFHEEVPFEFIAAVFGVMAACPGHTFQVLTKRPERMLEFFRWMEAERRGYMHEHRGLLWDHLGQIAGEQFSQRTSQAAFRARDGDVVPRSIGDMCAWPWPLPNVWLGVSVEDQQRADERIPLLLQCPAAVRWISAEPLLGAVDISRWLEQKFDYCPEANANPDDGSWDECAGCPAEPGRIRQAIAYGSCFAKLTPRLDWVVVGGESGQHMHQERLLRRRGLVQKVGSRDWRPREDRAEWVRSLRDQCAVASVPFFFKQWGGPYPKSGGRLLDGRTHDAYPQGGAA